MNLHIRLAALLIGLAFPLPAAALCVLCSCSVSVTSASFGGYDPTSPSPDDTTSTVTINCTALVSLLGAIDVTISPGTSGNALARQMAQGANRLNYNLYTDSARTIVWGDGNGGTGKVSPPFTGLLVFNTSLPVYGRVPAGQWVAAGPYTDSVVVTIVY